MKINLLAVASVAFIALAASAQAANIYQLKFTAGADQGFVDFTTASPWTPAGTAVTGASGKIDGSSITGLSNYASADNILYAAAPPVDYNGVSVSTALDTFNFANYFGSFVLTKASVNPNGYPQDLSAINGAIAGVPEPATWAMMLMGLSGFGALLRSSRRNALTA
jgi:hypothetical protein